MMRPRSNDVLGSKRVMRHFLDDPVPIPLHPIPLITLCQSIASFFETLKHGATIFGLAAALFPPSSMNTSVTNQPTIGRCTANLSNRSKLGNRFQRNVRDDTGLCRSTYPSRHTMRMWNLDGDLCEAYLHCRMSNSIRCCLRSH
jgi:hypothetical protein